MICAIPAGGAPLTGSALALVLLYRGNVEEALSVSHAAVQRDSRAPAAWSFAAVRLFQARHFSEAATAWEHLLEFRPSTADSAALLTAHRWALLEAGDCASALAAGRVLAAITALLSLLPIGGTALVWVPVAGYLFVSGPIWKGIAMVAWGGLVVVGGDGSLSIAQQLFARLLGNDQVDDVKGGQKESRTKGSSVKLGHRDAQNRPHHNEHDARRNENAQGSSGGDRP